jgi:homoserine kinase
LLEVRAKTVPEKKLAAWIEILQDLEVSPAPEERDAEKTRILESKYEYDDFRNQMERLEGLLAALTKGEMVPL